VFTPDRGPWRADVWRRQEGDAENVRVVITSDDFDHDAALVVTGDFETFEAKVAYAEDLAARMNLMPGARPLNWREKA
jgi:hypothetical protein